MGGGVAVAVGGGGRSGQLHEPGAQHRQLVVERGGGRRRVTGDRMIDLGVLRQRHHAGGRDHADGEDGVGRVDRGGRQRGGTDDEAAHVVEVDGHAVAGHAGGPAVAAVQAQGVAAHGAAGAVGTVCRHGAEGAAEVGRGRGGVAGRRVAIGFCILGRKQHAGFAGDADRDARAVVLEGQRLERIGVRVRIDQRELADVE